MADLEPYSYLRQRQDWNNRLHHQHNLEWLELVNSDRQSAQPQNSADAARPRRRGDRMKRREFITLVGGQPYLAFRGTIAMGDF
jgi:hypothetical protein